MGQIYFKNLSIVRSAIKPTNWYTSFIFGTFYFYSVILDKCLFQNNSYEANEGITKKKENKVNL